MENRRAVTGILIAAFAARCVAAIVFDLLHLAGTGNEHWVLATSLHRGLGFAFDWYGLFDHPVVGSFIPPLYPWILAGFLRVAGGSLQLALHLAQLLNAILGMLTCGLVIALAERRCRDLGPGGAVRHAPLAAGLLWALYPPAVGASAITNTSILEAFLLLLLLHLVIRAAGSPEERAPYPTAIATGLVLGALLLSRPTAGVVWVGLGLLVLLRRRGRAGDSSRARMRFLLLASVIAVLAILPWAARNSRVHGAIVPVSTNGGFNFYMGNNSGTVGEIPRLDRFFARMPEPEKEIWRARTEIQRDRRLYQMGREFWEKEPGMAVEAVGRKVVSYLFFRPYLFAGYPGWLAAVFVGSYVLLFVPFVASLRRCRDIVCLSVLIAFAATGIVACAYIVSMRFRASVEPLMMVVASPLLARPLIRLLPASMRVSGRKGTSPS
jgi:hypothetical protein